MNVKFHAVVFRLMVFMKCKRLQRNMMQVLLNEGFERENSPNFLQHFSFWCSDKNGEFIEEQQGGMPSHPRKTPSSCLSADSMQQVNKSFTVWFAKFLLQLIFSRASPACWAATGVCQVTVRGNLFHWEDLGDEWLHGS